MKFQNGPLAAVQLSVVEWEFCELHCYRSHVLKDLIFPYVLEPWLMVAKTIEVDAQSVIFLFFGICHFKEQSINWGYCSRDSAGD